MQYLIILLLLTACTPKAENTQAAAASPPELEAEFDPNEPAWTTNAGVVGETQNSCVVGFSEEFSPTGNILSQDTLKQFVKYCAQSSPTYALDWALTDGWHISNIVALVDMGADITNMTNNYGVVESPYIYIYRENTGPPLFKYLKEKQVPLPDNALRNAFGAGREDLFNYFLEQGADVHWTNPGTGSSILHFFLRDEQTPMVKTLLQKGLNPNLTNQRGLTAFVHLLSIDKLSTAKVLLEYTDTSILPPGQTNLMEAALWAKRKFYKDNNLYNGLIPDLEPEVVQFISNLSKGK